LQPHVYSLPLSLFQIPLGMPEIEQEVLLLLPVLLQHLHLP